MNLIENVQLALAGLWSGKMRALLTMLGIIIGISSVIAIFTVGDSLTLMFTEQMASFGVNSIAAQLQYIGESDYVTMDDSDLISVEMIAALEAHMGGRLAATSVSESVGQGQVRDGRKYANAGVTGVSPGYMLANNIELTKGRFIVDRDQEKRRNTAVISDFMAAKIFGSQDPLGKEIKIYTEASTWAFTVVGVYKYEQNAMMMGGSAGAEEDTTTEIYIPVSTAQHITGNSSGGYYWFMMMATPGEDIEAVTAEIDSFINDRFYSGNENWSIMVVSMQQEMGMVTSVLEGISIAIAFIAGISLLVGGIGVMNIMLVSVTERTREIGTRKALGARNSAIRIQFIVEAVIICTIGGLIGIAIGIALGSVGSGMLEGVMFGTTGTMKTAIPYDAVALAVGGTMLIGIFFGFYPANKAARLDPIEALRYE
ncbi:MAG: ABC transporter permease [Oscillospiraceae bacterium]|nr:ABC transporter permease [Oscillospiraceae bacterium]